MNVSVREKEEATKRIVFVAKYITTSKSLSKDLMEKVESQRNLFKVGGPGN